MLGNRTTGLTSHWPDESWTSAAGWSCTKAHIAWMAAVPLNLANHPTHVVVDLGRTRSIGSRAAIEKIKKHAWYYGITTAFGRCNKSFVFANSEMETRMESCIIHFPTAPPCSTQVAVLETSDVCPSYFPFPQMKNLGMTIELDPKGDKITCPVFWPVLLSSRVVHNGTCCVGPDESCVPAKNQVV